MNSKTPDAFKYANGSEVLSDVVVGKSSSDLIAAILSISLCFGVKRTEMAVMSTYPAEQAKKIIEMVNFALRLMAA